MHLLKPSGYRVIRKPLGVIKITPRDVWDHTWWYTGHTQECPDHTWGCPDHTQDDQITFGLIRSHQGVSTLHLGCLSHI